MAVISKLVVGACALASFVHAAPVAQAAGEHTTVTVTDFVTVTTWVTQDVPTTIYQAFGAAPAVPTSSSESSVSTTTTQAPASTSAAVFIQQVSIPSAVTPVVQPTTLQTTTIAAVRSASPAPDAGASGACSSGAPCSGDVTHWEGGLGACGWSVNTESDMQIALPVGMMGSQSNGNPFCGKSLSIKNTVTGATIQATVGDKCMGCTGNSIDLTNALFKAVTNGQGDGRVSGVEWWFN